VFLRALLALLLAGLRLTRIFVLTLLGCGARFLGGGRIGGAGSRCLALGGLLGLLGRRAHFLSGGLFCGIFGGGRIGGGCRRFLTRIRRLGLLAARLALLAGFRLVLADYFIVLGFLSRIFLFALLVLLRGESCCDAGGGD